MDKAIEAAAAAFARIMSCSHKPHCGADCACRQYAEEIIAAYHEAGGTVPVPVEPTEDMLAATCDEHGRPRILEFTRPEERSKAFLMARYIYRAMLAARPEGDG